jgi:hypothetical protein
MVTPTPCQLSYLIHILLGQWRLFATQAFHHSRFVSLLFRHHSSDGFTNNFISRSITAGNRAAFNIGLQLWRQTNAHKS